jgi:L-ribulokinase
MGKVRRSVYVPDAQRSAAYDALFAVYSKLHDQFADGAVMHRLREIRNSSAG